MSGFFEHVAVTLVSATIGGLLLGGMIQLIRKIQLAMGADETSTPKLTAKAESK